MDTHDERDQWLDGGSAAGEEEAVRRLLESAGPRPPIPRADLDAITGAMRGAWRMQVRRRQVERWRRGALPLAAALAAMIVVAVGAGWWWLARRAAVTPPAVAQVEAASGPLYVADDGGGWRALAGGESVPEGAVLRTGGAAGEPAASAALRLAGGALLRIDRASRLRFDSAATIALGAGAIYADTGATAPGGDAGAALAVRTAVGTARDIGTRFAVRLHPAPVPAMRVQVREGAVVVEGGGRSWEAAAGEELVLRGDGHLERHEIAAYGPGWDWVIAAGPGFAIEGRTLGELLDWVTRETGWQVRFADPAQTAAAREIVLHGNLAGLHADEAPFAVLPGAGLEGELKDGVLTIRRTVTAPR